MLVLIFLTFEVNEENFRTSGTVGCFTKTIVITACEKPAVRNKTDDPMALCLQKERI